MHDSVSQGISETEGELNKAAQSAQPKIDPYDDPFADGPPPAAAPATAQGELPLEPGQQSSAQKQG
ncbi:hypothetical protein D3C83_11660 [compost metagenome]